MKQDFTSILTDEAATLAMGGRLAGALSSGITCMVTLALAKPHLCADYCMRWAMTAR